VEFQISRDEIHERIEQLGVEASHCWIGTIHAFCLGWILRTYAIYHDALKHGFRVINARDTERVQEELWEEATSLGLNILDSGHYFTPGLRRSKSLVF
jgi:DNA helicase II / ATP-dependent DNA helicase PcrA